MAEKQCYDAFLHSDEKDAIQKLKKMKGDPREMKYWYSTTILHFAAYHVQLLITEYQFDPIIKLLHYIGLVNTDIQTLSSI